MGKKHRERRKRLKKAIRRDIPKGWREDELGQLRKKVSKAEARERYLRAYRAMELRRVAEQEIIEAAVREATREIHELEDAQVFADMNQAVADLQGAAP